MPPKEVYLRDLRANRPARPAGARPAPPSAYQQRRAAAAAAAASSSSGSQSQVPASASSSYTPHYANTTTEGGQLSRNDSSHRRSKTTSGVSFSRQTTEYPPEPAQRAVLDLENNVSDLSLESPPSNYGQQHGRSKSAQGLESHYSTGGGESRQNPHLNHPLPAKQRERIDSELHEHFQNMPAPVAPLKINKTNGGTVGVSPSSSSASRSSDRAPYVPSPSRYVYNESNQFHRVKYTTNPTPLPSPPPETASDEKVDIGTREERGRPPLPMIKIKKQPPEPPVIAVVEAPASPPTSTRIVTPPATAVPKFAVSEPTRPVPVPVIRAPQEEERSIMASPVPFSPYPLSTPSRATTVGVAAGVVEAAGGVGAVDASAIGAIGVLLLASFPSMGPALSPNSVLLTFLTFFNAGLMTLDAVNVPECFLWIAAESGTTTGFTASLFSVSTAVSGLVDDEEAPATPATADAVALLDDDEGRENGFFAFCPICRNPSAFLPTSGTLPPPLVP